LTSYGRPYDMQPVRGDHLAVGDPRRLPVVRPAYRAEYKKMESEAAVKFPPGSHAPAFEAWFAEHGAVREPMSPGEVEGACQPRRMQLKRVEGCVNLMTANYCVSPSDKIERLTFSDGGYC
jgi:hypothetical protein